MNCAASNIAWLPDADERVAAILRASGFDGVEIAPTRYWSDPASVNGKDAERVRQFWNDRQLDIVGLQSLLFARPESALFASENERAAMLTYLSNIASLAQLLGARIMVFGSPRNRTRGQLTMSQAFDIAVPFFRKLGDAAAAANVIIGVEPNPAAYNCDFVTNTAEGVDLIARVDHEHVRLHLDAGALALNREDPANAVALAAPYLCHVHCSEENLQPIGTTGFAHEHLAHALKQHRYDHWVSVEMRAPEGINRDEILDASLRIASRAYGA